MKPLMQDAGDVFAWAKGVLPKAAELEVYLGRGRGRHVSWSEKKSEDISQSEGGGAGVRVILKGGASAGRQGFSFTTDFSRASVEKVAQEALESAKFLPEDAFRSLPERSGGVRRMEHLSDPKVFSQSVTALMEKLRLGEDGVLKKNPLVRSILSASFSEGEGETAIINSKGVEESFPGTSCSVGMSCLAEKDGERQEGGFAQSRRYAADLDWNTIFDTAAERTVALLGARSIPSGTVPVLMDPSVACGFLSLISNAVCADPVQKGKSFLKGRIGESVASPLVSVVDDGTLEKGLGTSPVDDEGVPTQKTDVISGGRLSHFLHDTYTALKDGTVSTGNASRAGFKSSPSSGTSNFFLVPGKVSREKLLAGTTGLYLYEVMGLHMADPVSGDFSVGAIGAWIENGAVQYGVRGVTLAGNLLDLFKNVDGVADDMTFFGAIGSPTLRVSGMAVSGS